MTDKPEKKPAPLWQLLLQFVGQAFLFTICGVAIWVSTGRSTNEFVDFDLTFAVLGIALGFGLSLYGGVTGRYFPRFSERMVELQRRNFEFLLRPFPLPAIVLLSICAGVGEEALFRGGLQTHIGDYIGPHLAIIISSVLFALIHWVRPILIATIFAIGVFFGYIYWLTDSLLLVMVAHTVYDIFAISALQKHLRKLSILEKEAEDNREVPANAEA